MLAKIQSFLDSSRSLPSLIAIYNEFGQNSMVKRMLPEGGHFIIDKAIAELEEKLSEAQQQTSVAPTYIESVYQELRSEPLRLYKEASRLHQQLPNIKDDKTRAKACKRILQIQQDILPPLWERADTYKQTGKVPELVTSDSEYEADPVKMHRRLMNLRTYVSQNKDKAGKGEKIRAWEKEIKYYEKKLKLNQS